MTTDLDHAESELDNWRKCHAPDCLSNALAAIIRHLRAAPADGKAERGEGEVTHQVMTSSPDEYEGTPGFWVMEALELDEDGQPSGGWFAPWEGGDDRYVGFQHRAAAEAVAEKQAASGGYQVRVVRYVPGGGHMSIRNVGPFIRVLTGATAPNSTGRNRSHRGRRVTPSHFRNLARCWFRRQRAIDSAAKSDALGEGRKA